MPSAPCSQNWPIFIFVLHLDDKKKPLIILKTSQRQEKSDELLLIFLHFSI